MSLIPQVIIPLGLASLLQNLFLIDQRSYVGVLMVPLAFILWNIFVTRTKRGKIVYESWFVDIEPKTEKQIENYEPSFIDLANHEDLMDARSEEYSSYGLWRKYIEKDKYLSSKVDIDYFSEELLEIEAIQISERKNSRQQQLYKIKSEKIIEEHVKKYFERPFGWQSFMALKRKFSRRKSA